MNSRYETQLADTLTNQELWFILIAGAAFLTALTAVVLLLIHNTRHRRRANATNNAINRLK